ncbi:lactam utilization protein LamB [Candidatus Francisella endociliophora]|uniref:Lactam utilization protein LamB n=1 Tax=Candidatus Francisella endociliophora TaxID=653937 RepID=A0A097EQ15_9GAMM|nr:5-oxoprolinase subunit PxpA [Francisella sp. FSC1006]AIT09663.1 lactam utilization protein LamB [Francisella sp. FSC1006]
MLLINCDLGERGVAHPVDDQLVSYIDMANIACGGHAGDKQSVDYYVNLCKQNNVKITAHISYPDKENFGRKVIEIENAELCQSFDKQFTLFDDQVKAIKPHGALYNELNVNEELAKVFVSWCVKNNIQELVLSPFGKVKKYARASGIKVIKESFAERGYQLDINGNPMLIPRGQPNAEIHNVEKAVKQFKQLQRGYIDVNAQQIVFESQTICIHSDSAIALELAKELYSNKG